MVIEVEVCLSLSLFIYIYYIYSVLLVTIFVSLYRYLYRPLVLPCSQRTKRDSDKHLTTRTGGAVLRFALVLPHSINTRLMTITHTIDKPTSQVQTNPTRKRITHTRAY